MEQRGENLDPDQPNVECLHLAFPSWLPVRQMYWPDVPHSLGSSLCAYAVIRDTIKSLSSCMPCRHAEQSSFGAT